MKTRETKKQQKTDVILSEATDGTNKVRLMGTARAEEGEEECPWEEIDAYSGRFVVAGYRYGGEDTSNDFHPWLAYSTDGGETWMPSTTTSEESQPHGELFALTYGGGRFVVAGWRYSSTGGDTSNNYHPWIAYSTDGGKTWTPSTTTSEESQPHGRLYALAYGGGRFVVAGYRYSIITGDTSENYHPWIAYSTDGGETWTPSTTTSKDSQPHGMLHALAYGGGRFVVAGYRYGEDTSDDFHPWLAYSTDGGETWMPSTTTSEESQPHGELFALTYGGGRFVVSGHRYGATSGDASNNYHPWLAYSTDGGKTWTPSTTTADVDQTHGQLYALAYGGGRFVVAGLRYSSGARYNPWIAYSTDGGETWEKNETTSEVSQPEGRLLTLAYGGGRFVVAGYRYSSTSGDSSENYHPWIAYSTDGGKTWEKNETTSAEEQPHGELYALTYAPDSYCWKFGKEEETKETTE